MIKAAGAFLEKNLSVARAMARTPAGASFLRWGGIGAGMGAIYGMADNVMGQDRTSVGQGAIRGAMWGMGARGLFGGFRGLKPGSAAALKAGKSNAIIPEVMPRGWAPTGNPRLPGPNRPLLGWDGVVRGPGWTMGGPAPRSARSRPPRLPGPSSVPLLPAPRPGQPVYGDGFVMGGRRRGAGRRAAQGALSPERMRQYWGNLDRYHPVRTWERIR